MTAPWAAPARSRWFDRSPPADETPREGALRRDLLTAVEWADGLVQVPDPGADASLVGGKALVDHYATNRMQTFHHEPSVAAVVIDGLTAAGWLLSPPLVYVVREAR